MSRNKKHRKLVSKRLDALSLEMLNVSSLLYDFSPENADQLEGAALQVSEWAEDIMLEE
jgi:hypothetical protein